MEFLLKKSHHYLIYAIILVILFCMFGSIVYYQYGKNVNFDNDNELINLQKASAMESQKLNVPVSKKITLLAVGDIMMHQAQLDATYNKKTDAYNFSNFFVNIKPYLNNADIVYANLETPIAGKELKYSGYPKFNAPIELLTELKNNYFTHLSLANNHALDRGTVGLSNTIKNVNDSGFVSFGARELDEANTENYKITEKNGMKVGFLAYTYDTNGLVLPKNKVGMISYINKEQIVKDISDLKKQNVDVVVTAIHFGVEYKLEENATQRELAQLACDNGADIILGDHPHVLEPIVYLNDSVNDKKCLVIYSLGNFISGMTNPYTDLGGILKIDITKTFNARDNTYSGPLSISPSFLGTWVKRGTNKDGSKYFTVLPLDADKIPQEIDITKTEQGRLETYRKFVDTKITAGIN